MSDQKEDNPGVGDTSEKRKAKGSSESPSACKKLFFDLVANENPIYKQRKVIKSLARNIAAKKDFTTENGARVIATPFVHCVLPDFLHPSEYVTSLIGELTTLTCNTMNKDLGKFKQSNNLDGIHKSLQFNVELLTRMYEYMKDGFRKWVSEVTGFRLEESLDMSVTIFGQNDHLLCHSNLYANVKIACIYYLAEDDWSVEDGGTLDMFSIKDGLPDKIICSHCPKKNDLIFFEVTSDSYLQISEILTDKKLLAINGWFCGVPALPHKTVPDVDSKLIPGDYEGRLEDFIQPRYFLESVRKEIIDSFKYDSEIPLPEFLTQSVYAEVTKELVECDLWKTVGPPHKRFYEELDLTMLPPATKRLFQFLHSNCYLRFLSKLTSLELYNEEDADQSPNKENQLPSCGEHAAAQPSTSSSESASACNSAQDKIDLACYSTKIAKFGHRNYSLLCNARKKVSNSSEMILDAVIFLNCSEWKESYGGELIFSNAGDEDMLDVTPIQNCMSLVYRGVDDMYFTKYINAKVTERDSPFYITIHTSHYERKGEAEKSRPSTTNIKEELPKKSASAKSASGD